MLTISKPLSAGQARAYHSKEFTSAEQAYYNQHGQVRGVWHGKLAEEWGLKGEVTEAQFTRLVNGQHPETGEQLVRHRESFEYRKQDGEKVKTMEHRAGWDATFSAPKSVSLTALVGGDQRVRQAHAESVAVALDELEQFVQARMGGNNAPQTTGKWVAARFEHDSARPVDGYAAPQLHTHVVFFNLTRTEDGRTRAIQPQELYRSQQYGTSVYRAELAHRLREMGYEIEAGTNGAPEIRGYSQEYLAASSPRSRQIKAHLEEHGLEGAGAAQIAAHRTRDAKSPLSVEEMMERHRELARAFGNQPQRVVEEARARVGQQQQGIEDRQRRAQEAVTYSRDRHIEREAVVDERDLMRDALRRSMGKATFREVRENLEQRLRSGELIEVAQERTGTAGRPFQQLQEAGMRTAHLDEIIRQKDPTLKQAVEQLAGGEVRAAIDNLRQQGRVHGIRDRQERMEAIAKAYAEHPEQTLVISPDNTSRQEINSLIHRERQSRRRVGQQEHQVRILVPRQEMTGADRQWAAQYEGGDIVRYTRGSQALDIEAGEYVRVASVNRQQNLVTVERASGEQLTYDPRRLHGVSVYRQAEREFSAGERVQFTAPYRDEHIANRQLGMLKRIDSQGNLQIRLDSGREVQFNIGEHPHLDYGYAVTSHSSQGATADRVLIHVDTEQAHEKLINTRLAYVSVSRARYDAQIYTNDAASLGEGLSKDVSKRSALEAEMSSGYTPDEPDLDKESRAPDGSQREQVQREHSQEQSMGR